MLVILLRNLRKFYKSYKYGNKSLTIVWTCKYCSNKNELKIEQINEVICECSTKMNDKMPSKTVSLK